MHQFRRLIPVMLGAMFAFSNAAHADDRVTCESFNDRRSYCDVARAYDADIRMVRRLSDSACNEGVSWGHDDRGIWVDRGCRAEFSVRTGYSKGGYNGHNHHGYGGYGDDSGYNHEREELERERERLAAERARLEREKATPQIAPLNCPPGTHPSTHRCTKAERKKGCKDYGANDGTGRGCSNF